MTKWDISFGRLLQSCVFLLLSHCVIIALFNKVYFITAHISGLSLYLFNSMEDLLLYIYADLKSLSIIKVCM